MPKDKSHRALGDDPFEGLDHIEDALADSTIEAEAAPPDAPPPGTTAAAMSARTCPYLGLRTDRTAMFSFPSEEHHCFAGGQERSIALAHQTNFCLGRRYELCDRFVPVAPVDVVDERASRRSPLDEARKAQRAGAPDTAPELLPAEESWEEGRAGALSELVRELSPMRVALWATAALLLVVVVYYYGSRLFGPQPNLPASTPVRGGIPVATATVPASPTATATPTATVERATALVTPLPTPTLVLGGRYYSLVPAAGAVGWVSSGDELTHFGERNIHVGIFKEQTYFGIMQFDLSPIPAGAQIAYAALSLTGLSDENIGATGTWQAQILDSTLDENWRNLTFKDVQGASVVQTLAPAMSPADLGRKRVNSFVFTTGQRDWLAQRVATGKLSLRIRGPGGVADNLFTWDSGYGGGFGNRPTLLVVAVPPPTPTPIVVTSTPRPANVFEAATRVALATLYATTTGTATPLPPNIVTATPLGKQNPLVITNTPTPANAATATFVAILQTAVAATTGTPTPIPAYVSTVTPHPPYVIITAVPTPADVFAAATRAAQATRQARHGTATPLPANWVTPTDTPTALVVFNTPTPANAATATYVAAYATALAATTGTATPLPPNAVTATATPVSIPLEALTPSPTATLPPAPTAVVHIPSSLYGKILFLSDRFGGSNPVVLAMDPDGGNASLVTNRDVYDRALTLDQLSTDGSQQVFVRNYKGDFQIWVMNRADGYSWYLAGRGGQADYDPVWAPDGARVAYVAQRDRDANDEIHVVDKDVRSPGGEFMDTRITQNLVMDKHPSWSPDSKQIVFWSNRVEDPALWKISEQTKNRQIWISDDDGQHQHNISNNAYEDWDPVWVKPYWP
ncbi:MAG: hypothetical protein GXP41_08310 [Chloroflexi bacterium]|nr:hypothetical protein [Chloroflexota bacterium]